MRKKKAYSKFLFLALCYMVSMTGHASQEKAGPQSIVHVIEVESIITPVSAEFITSAIEKSGKRRRSLFDN